MHAEPEILRLLRAHGFQLMEQAHADAVNRAVEALSPETRATDPLVLGLRGVREAHAGRFDRAESLLERAISVSTDRAFSGELAARLAYVLFNQGRDVIALLEPYAADEALPNVVRAKALSFLVPAYAYAQRKDDAYAAMSKAEEFAGIVESEELRAQLFQRMGIAGVTLVAPFDHVCGLFSRAQALSNDNGLYVTLAAALGGLGTAALFYADDIAKTVWYAQQSMNAAQKAGDRLSVQNSLLLQIHVETRRGNSERVLALEQQFGSATTTDVSRLGWVIPAHAMRAAWDGRFDEAYRLLSTVADKTLFYNFDRVFNSAVQSIYAVSAGKRERAIELVASTLQEIDESEFGYFYGRVTAEIARALCAVTEAIAGRVTHAQRILARKPMEDTPTVEAVRQCALAVCRVVKSPALGDEVLEAIEQVRAVGHGGVGMVVERAIAALLGSQAGDESPLTKAEMDVLAALSQGRSPKEIAHETGRSVYTIQAHIQNVIRKLGCSGRNEALSVARRRGLVS
jgi:DNA-binding NarL/FixJ family response regulator